MLTLAAVLFATPTFAASPVESRARTFMQIDALLEEGRGERALELYFDMGRQAPTPTSFYAHRFASSGFFAAAEEILGREASADPGLSRNLMASDIRVELDILAGRYEQDPRPCDPFVDPRKAARILDHLGRSEEALELLREFYWAREAPQRELREEQQWLLLSAGRFHEAAELRSPREGIEESGPGWGGCALGSQALPDHRQIAQREALLLLCDERYERARRTVAGLGLQEGLLALALQDPERCARIVRSLVRLRPEGLPPLSWMENRRLPELVPVDAQTAWLIYTGQRGAMPGQSPSRGLRLVGLAHLLDDPEAESFAAEALGGPDEACALALLALQHADGVLEQLERRIRDAFLDRDPARREELYRIVTLHGTPAAYALLRTLANDADADLAREIRVAMWRDPPWKRTSWADDFLPTPR